MNIKKIIFKTSIPLILLLLLMFSPFFSKGKICNADELRYKELEFAKTYTGEATSEEAFDEGNEYSFTLSKKTKISIDFESLTKNTTPGKLYISISSDDYKDDFYANLSCFFPYKRKVTQNITLDKGTYNIWISNDLEVCPFKYKFKFNEVTSDTDDVKLEKNDINVLIGSSYQLLLLNGEKVIVNKEIKWESSNTDIVTVKSGKITAIKEGTCKITITLPNGNKLKCSVAVPKPTLERQLYSKSVYAFVESVEDESIYNDCCIYVMNNSSKDIVHSEYEIIQYNSRGQFIKSPYSAYYDDDTLETGEFTQGVYWVNNDARKARVCIKNVTFSDGTVWNNPLYKTWHNKYYGKKY